MVEEELIQMEVEGLSIDDSLVTEQLDQEMQN